MWVVLTAAQHAVVAALHYAKGKDGPRGRALARDFPELGLLRGDRLEAGKWLLGVAKFDSVYYFPVPAYFWKQGVETRVTFCKALWDPTMVLRVDTLAVDSLRAVFLGPALIFVGTVIFLLLVDCDFWGLAAGLARDARWQVNVQNLRMLLRKCYSAQRRLNPDKQLTELEDLNLNMIGKKLGTVPNLKAVETKHAVPFALELLHSTPAAPEPRRAYLIGAGEALVSFIRTVDDAPPVLDMPPVANLHQSYRRFIRFCQLGAIPLKPKTHLFGHLVNRAARQGNPRMHGTFDDDDDNEGLNHVVKPMGSAPHRSVWEYRVSSSFGQWERTASQKRRRV